MINELDKQILQKINFAEKYLKIGIKYIKQPEDVDLFKKKDISLIFNDLEYDFKYIKGGAYVISKELENYRFELSFNISYNIPNIYLYVYKDGELLDRGISNFSYTLNFIEFENELLNNNFGLNSLEDLKNYIMDITDIFNDYIKEFIWINN